MRNQIELPDKSNQYFTPLSVYLVFKIRINKRVLKEIEKSFIYCTSIDLFDFESFFRKTLFKVS